MLTVPTVHLNGTSRDALIEQLSAAASALDAAIAKLEDAGPNARDYYVQGPDAFAGARREHEARVQRLSDVRHELDVLMVAVDEQGG